MFLFNLFTTDDRVQCNIDRINRNRAEPDLNILMLQYKYDRCELKKIRILALANEHDFSEHNYLGMQLLKNDRGIIEIVLN